MKINGTGNKIYRPANLGQASKNVQTNGTTGKKETALTNHPNKTNKLNIPEDYQPKLTLTKEEQKFFENLYPRDKNRIQQYLKNQNNIQVEKGKIVDLKG